MEGEEYNLIIKSHVLSSVFSISWAAAGASHYTTDGLVESGEWARVVVVVVVVAGRNAGDVLRLLGIQPQLGTVMLPVLS